MKKEKNVDISKKLNGLDLFSGIGGISYALQDWIRPVAYCEIEPYCQSVLLQRMQEGNLPKAPIWDDIRSFTGEHLQRVFGSPSGLWESSVDILYGGFPCQDISVAGNGKGLEGERSGLFFEIVRICGELRPQFIFLENVPAITSRGGRRVVGEITEMGYDCRWCVISAAGVGALHRRERWFFLAYSKHNGESTREGGGSIRSGVAQGEQHEQKKGVGKIERTSCLSENVANTHSLWEQQSERIEQNKRKWFGYCCKNVANSQSKGLERFGGSTFGNETAQPKPSLQSQDDCNTSSKSSGEKSTGAMQEHLRRTTWGVNSRFYRPFASRYDWQKTVESVGKCIDGISAKLDNNTEQLKALGNAVVPQQVRQAWLILTGLHYQ